MRRALSFQKYSNKIRFSPTRFLKSDGDDQQQKQRATAEHRVRQGWDEGENTSRPVSPTSILSPGTAPWFHSAEPPCCGI